MRALLVPLALFLCLSSFSLKDKMLESAEGDYIVTEQLKNYTLLSVRSRCGSTLLLEEITAPTHAVSASSWPQWVAEGAPGHTSWCLYEIDLDAHALLESFSFSEMSWLYLDESDHFLSRLLSLPLHRLSEEEKRRIGPPPARGEPDRRRFWTPPVVIAGQKVDKPSVDSWQTSWPKDDTQLSECRVELYFDRSRPAFPFPVWIEVKNGHYTFKVCTVDSGSGLVSPIKRGMPRRPPQILESVRQPDASFLVTVKAPRYYKGFQLFVTDLSQQPRETLPLPFTTRAGAESELLLLTVPAEILRAHLRTGHRYQWLLMPDSVSGVWTESHAFVWE
jgi:hypothetical protein